MRRRQVPPGGVRHNKIGSLPPPQMTDPEPLPQSHQSDLVVAKLPPRLRCTASARDGALLAAVPRRSTFVLPPIHERAVFATAGGGGACGILALTRARHWRAGGQQCALRSVDPDPVLLHVRRKDVLSMRALCMHGNS